MITNALGCSNSLNDKKLHLERQLLRLRAAYLGKTDENPYMIIEEIFNDTYCHGEGTPESPAFKIRWDSALAHIVSYSTAKLIRIYKGDKHVDDVLNNLFMLFSSRERFLKIKEEYMLSSIYQLITYNGTKGGSSEINEIFQIESCFAEKNQAGKKSNHYFRLESFDDLEKLEKLQNRLEDDPLNTLIENEIAGNLIDMCNEIHYLVKRWVKSKGYDYDAFVEDVLANNKRNLPETEYVFKRMGAHWTKPCVLRREMEKTIRHYTCLSRNKDFLQCMNRFLTARRLIVLSITIHYRGDWCL